MPELEDIADLPGFGPSKIDNFKEAGYDSLEDLRGITWDELGEIKGIGSSAKRRAIINLLEEEGLRDKPEKEEKYEKFRELLEELFQFESADLDFGIYRIMNEKRDRIEQFLDEELQEKVEDELKEFQATEQGEAEEQLEKVKDQIKEEFPNWVDESGNVNENEIPDDAQGIVEERKKEYFEAKKEAEKAEIGEETEAAIYQDLYRFFKRYYKDGDFIPQRRAASQEKYAIPYNGEEVKLHWANKEQYFVKTGEHFKDYKFRIRKDSYNVQFKLHDAHVEKNNKKGDDKYFVLRDENAIEQEDYHLTVHFEYRPLTEDDFEKYDLSENSRTKARDIQDSIEERIKSEVSGQLEDALSQEVEDSHSDSSVIEKHLRNYRTKNENDYFIHKDLRGFLQQELDFYLKNEVFSWGEMTDDSGEIPAHVRARLNAIENIANEIIDFVSEIEDFQKKLYEKKKFVYGTDYMVTLDEVPDRLYDKILENEDQLDQWRETYAINEWEETLMWTGEFNEDFLQNNPYLMIDTAFFDDDFKYTLLDSFNDIEKETDGVLIKGENFQSLNLLQERYQENIDCIHIDPPYNTETSEFKYKNNYRHSSWISMMKNRIDNSYPLLSEKGVYFCHIDDNEYENLLKIFDDLDLVEQGTIVWDKRSPAPGSSTIARQHEYVIARSKNLTKLKTRKSNAQKILDKADELIEKNGGVTENTKQEFKSWVKNQDEFTGGEKAYCELDEEGRVYQSVHLGASEQRTDEKYFKPLIHPETNEPCPVPSRGWTGGPEFMDELLENDEIIFGEDETKQPRRKYFLDENLEGELTSVIQSAERGKKYLDRLGLEFPYCHPVSVYSELNWSGIPDGDGTLLDFFAGSGTNAQSIINLNRDDGGDRKYILIEMGEYFDTVLRPRVQKTVFAKEWKEGIPQDHEGISQVVKYQRLEDYEDALNNLDAQGEQSNMESFMSNTLEYFLNFEVDGPSLLDLDCLKEPFEYKMELRDGDESEKETIDLVETFNYLLGLEVKKLQRYENEDREYRVVKGELDDEEIAVVWRKIEDDDEEDFFEQERDFLNSDVLNDEDVVYINHDSALEDAKSIEKTFQKRMWE